MAKHKKWLEARAAHNEGCVTKCEPDYKKKNNHSYRWNGHEEMKTAAKSDIYNIDFTIKANSKRLPRIFKEYAYTIKKGKKKIKIMTDPEDPREPDNKKAWWLNTSQNFQKNYLPYVHDYHHILPMESLHSAFINDKGKLHALMLAKYNLNGKLNMIILPKLSEYGIALKLPSHPYDHREYRENVKNKIASIYKNFEEAKEDHEEEKEVDYEGIKKDLENWQQRQFKVIVEYGQDVIAKLDPEEKQDPCQIDNVPMARIPNKR